MKSRNITLVKIEADDGMVLTNGAIFGKTLYLGANDDPDNYWEVTEEEAERMQAEIEERENEENDEAQP